jgi:hypothetical protein
MNHVHVTYTISPTGPSAAAIQVAMQAPPTPGAPGVPVPAATLLALGLRVESDVQIGPGSLTRDLGMAFGPSAPGTATAVMGGNATLLSVTTTPGIDYVLPPVVSFTGGGPGGRNLIFTGKTPDGALYPAARAYLDVQNVAIPFAGTLYNAPTTTVAFIGGLPPALFLQPGHTKDGVVRTGDPKPNGPPYAVNAVSLFKQGRGYSASTYIRFEGGDIAAGGHAAQAVIAAFGPNGEIAAVQLIDPGALYQTIPSMVFVDPVPNPQASRSTRAQYAVLMGAGLPATATVVLGGGGTVTGLAGLTPGSGYVQPPTVVIYDSTGLGSGAVITPRMGVERVDVDFRGQGLVTAPAVVLTPFFKSMFPDTSDQKKPFYDFPLLFAIEQATASQVSAGGPVLS